MSSLLMNCTRGPTNRDIERRGGCRYALTSLAIFFHDRPKFTIVAALDNAVGVLVVLRNCDLANLIHAELAGY
jgi:hypothetical protein